MERRCLLSKLSAPGRVPHQRGSTRSSQQRYHVHPGSVDRRQGEREGEGALAARLMRLGGSRGPEHVTVEICTVTKRLTPPHTCTCATDSAIPAVASVTKTSQKRRQETRRTQG